MSADDEELLELEEDLTLGVENDGTNVASTDEVVAVATSCAADAGADASSVCNFSFDSAAESGSASDAEAAEGGGIIDQLFSHYVWYSKVVLAFAAAFVMGLLLVQMLRNYGKKAANVYKLTLLAFLVPILFFVALSAVSIADMCDRTISDAFTFGCFAGVVMKLMSPAGGKGTVKVLVQQPHEQQPLEVRLDSTDVTVGTVRDRIAAALKVEPKERVKIESGRGYLLEDAGKAFFETIDESHQAVDFFGFVTAACYITVEEKEDDDNVQVIEMVGDDGVLRKKKVRHNPFAALLHSKTRYGDSYHLNAKSLVSRPHHDVKPFHVAQVDKFAAAAPGNAPLFSTVRFLAWSANADVLQDVQQSEAAERDSMVSTVSHATSRTGLLSMFSHRRPDEHSSHGRPIRNGDKIIIESDGK